MMDVALKTHKETSFGWVLALRRLWAVLAAPPSPPKRRRYLTLR